MERANLNDYYVPSYCIDKNGKEFRLDDLFNEFLVDKGRNFLTLLGDFGTGKTSFSLYYYIYLAKQFLNDETKRIPIFVSLRNYKGKLDIEEFMKKEFYTKFGIKLSFAIFQVLKLMITSEKSNLQNLDLSYLNLKNIDLAEANLKEAILNKADLTKACLWGANLKGTNFQDANLHKAYLQGANLQWADLLILRFQVP
jgi:hypothetical protein